MAALSSSIQPTEPASEAGEPSVHADMAAWRARIDAAIRMLCDRHLAGVPAPVSAAMRYALSGEGKRIRGALTVEAFHAAGGTDDAAPLGAAVEIVHAYSLVHDDLPCMDDDDVRRGRPTVHREYGVAAATHAGVAMVPLAAIAATEAARALQATPNTSGRILRELMQASGASGMIGGQLLDLEGEGRALTLLELERVHRGKTGALLAAAARIGGIAAAADDRAVAALGQYGTAIGLAFQIADDVLDVTATSRELGKTAGRDEALRKSTYPALLGVSGAMARAQALVDEGCAALSEAGLLTAALEHLARFTVTRRS